MYCYFNATTSLTVLSGWRHLQLLTLQLKAEAVILLHKNKYWYLALISTLNLTQTLMLTLILIQTSMLIKNKKS